MLQRSSSGATVFEELAALASVAPSDASVETIRSRLIPLIGAIDCAAEIRQRRREILERLKAHRAAIEKLRIAEARLRKAAADYLAAFEECLDAADAHLDAYPDGLREERLSWSTEPKLDLPESEVDKLECELVELSNLGFSEFPDVGKLDFLRELATAPAAEPRSPAPRPDRRRKGRPSGSQKHQAFRQLVVGLLDVVDELGGNLTFSDAYPESGSLWPALLLVAPLLPAGFIPASVPASRLRRTHEAWRCQRQRHKIRRSPRATKN